MATAQQVGDAAFLREKFEPGSDMRKDLCFIVHHADNNPHKYGDNKYADKKYVDDPAAQATIDKAKNLANWGN